MQNIQIVRWMIQLCFTGKVLFGVVGYNLDLNFTRQKRVISGSPVLDLNGEYSSVRFFVWIASGHNCDLAVVLQDKDVAKNSLSFRSCAANSQNNICGGSLLTPTLVQTACQCVVSFGGDVRGFRSPTTLRVWEDMFDVYPGIEAVQKVRGAKARHYIRHPKCTLHSRSQTLFHDFALIALRKALVAKGLSVAPVYTILTLTKIWTRTMANRAVCLTVGYGRFLLMKNNQSQPLKPSVLLHGWVRALNFLECYDDTSLPSSYIGYRWDYKDATWFCAKVLPTKMEYPSGADSGGPLSCDNEYAGLVSINSLQNQNNHYSHTIASSTAFTITENSAEYRETLLNLVSHYETFDPQASLFSYRPTSPHIKMYVGRDSAIRARSSYLLVLTFVLNSTIYSAL